MAAPSAQTLQRVADETGHQLGTLEKVLRLLDLLQEIARDPAFWRRRKRFEEDSGAVAGARWSTVTP